MGLAWILQEGTGMLIAHSGRMSVEATEPPRESPDVRPLVSVIMPAFNSETFIAQAVESVIRQTLTDWELIVIDDGSDNPASLDGALAPFQDRLHLIRQANAGVSAARNAGLRAARSRFVAFLDSDDRWAPEFLATQVAMLEADPSLSLVYCDAWIYGDPRLEGRRSMEFAPSTGPADLIGLLGLRCRVLTSCTVARREAIVAAGLFDPTLVVSEDFDLWLRVLLQGGRIAYHRTPLVHYQVRPGSLSRDTHRMDQTVATILARYREALSEMPELAMAAAASIRKLEGAIALRRGKQALLEGNHPVAQMELARAREFLSGSKLALGAWLVRVVPRFMTATYRLVARHRGG